MHERLSAALTASGGAGSSTWPSARVLLQLKLLTTLFPVSDKRHPVMTPAALLVRAACVGRPVVWCVLFQ